jgi:hypothetical protein
MGKKTIESFIYNGSSDWYLRIPYTRPKGQSLRQVLTRRLEKVIELENEGLRKKCKGFNRICGSEKFIKEEADGKYEVYNNM